MSKFEGARVWLRLRPLKLIFLILLNSPAFLVLTSLHFNELLFARAHMVLVTFSCSLAAYELYCVTGQLVGNLFEAVNMGLNSI